MNIKVKIVDITHADNHKSQQSSKTIGYFHYKRMKFFILFSIILSHLFVSKVSSLKCFNCGYLELPDGKKVEVTEEFGKIPFCDDFTQNEENTIEAYAVRAN